jgi:NAD+ kinase
LIKSKDSAVDAWQSGHREHSRTVEEVERVLDRLGVSVMWVRRAQAMFEAPEAELVIVVGGDGTLLAASHSVADVPVLGVNSAPGLSVGFFSGARREDFAKKVSLALEGKLPSVTLTRMAVQVNGRLRSRRVLNEALYCHTSPAATSRYELRHGSRREEQRSSGFWIGPAAGSTAALRAAGGKVLPLDSTALQLVAREPYVMFGRRYKLLKLLIKEDERIVAKSKMDEASLFLDGPIRQIPIQLGDEVSFFTSDEPLKVLGLSRRRKS